MTIESGTKRPSACIQGNGHYCYLNALLQVLYEQNWFYEFTNMLTSSGSILGGCINQLMQLLTNTNKIYDFSFFYRYFEELAGLNIDQQNDAHEALTLLLDKMINKDADAQLLLDQSLQWTANLEFSPVSIEGIIYDIYVQEETRNEIQSILSNISFSVLPPNLIIHFCRTRFGVFQSKVFNEIQAQNTISIQTITGDVHTYELNGLIVHDGDSIAAGHYAAILKSNNE